MSYAKTSVTINFDKWIEIREKDTEDNALRSDWNGNWVRDISGLKYLDHKCNFTGFMNSPHAQYKGQVFMATTKHIYSISEFIIYCEEMIGDKNIFLYDLHYNVGLPRYFDIDPTTFEPVFLDRAIEFPKTGWRVRFGEL
jgi:hypothetical protein